MLSLHRKKECLVGSRPRVYTWIKGKKIRAINVGQRFNLRLENLNKNLAGFK